MTEFSQGADPARVALDMHEITQLVYRYCRAMDRIDHELGYSIWHEGATADYGEGLYQGSGTGFIDWVCEQHRQMIAHSHQVTNVIIELDGDLARTESYVTAALRLNDDGELKQITVRGRYLDRWSRRNGRWGIDRRDYVQDFDDIRSVTATAVLGRGQRDKSDLSYAVLYQK